MTVFPKIYPYFCALRRESLKIFYETASVLCSLSNDPRRVQIDRAGEQAQPQQEEQRHQDPKRQLLCLVIILCAYLYLFSVLKTALENVRDTGRAYSAEDAANAKKKYIIVTVFILLFSGVFEAVVAGILLCGLYNVTFVSER